LLRQFGWRGLQCCRAKEWRGKDFYVKIVVWRDGSCSADACGAAACFGRATDFGAGKRVRFENKNTPVIDLKFVFRKG
jgi:hypothetical protein